MPCGATNFVYRVVLLRGRWFFFSAPWRPLTPPQAVPKNRQWIFPGHSTIVVIRHRHILFRGGESTACDDDVNQTLLPTNKRYVNFLCWQQILSIENQEYYSLSLSL